MFEIIGMLIAFAFTMLLYKIASEIVAAFIFIAILISLVGYIL